jgi:hypothetical protein
VGGAGSRLEESGVDIGEVLDLEDSLGGVGTVFGKTAVHGDTMSLKVLAEQLITATAVEALAAKLRVIGNNTLTNLEALDLGTDSCDDANSFMARNQGELGNEFTLVDVQIGTADTASLDLDLYMHMG